MCIITKQPTYYYVMVGGTRRNHRITILYFYPTWENETEQYLLQFFMEIWTTLIVSVYFRVVYFSFLVSLSWNCRMVLHQSLTMNKHINLNSPPSATWDRASTKLETGDIPAVRLLSIHPSNVKYTWKLGFFANALATMIFAVLWISTVYTRGREKK